MPAGMGLHPYFPKTSGTRLTFDATGLWPADAPEAVALGAGPIEPGLDFRKGQDAADIVLDRCYEGWDGRATLTAADGATTTIEADPVFGKIQIYDAWDYPYICIEPVTNANDGFNRAALGVPGHAVAVLSPGQRLDGQNFDFASSTLLVHGITQELSRDDVLTRSEPPSHRSRRGDGRARAFDAGPDGRPRRVRGQPREDGRTGRAHADARCGRTPRRTSPATSESCSSTPARSGFAAPPCARRRFWRTPACPGFW